MTTWQTFTLPTTHTYTCIIVHSWQFAYKITSFSLSLSLTHSHMHMHPSTHTHTHTHAHTHAHTHTCTLTSSPLSLLPELHLRGPGAAWGSHFLLPHGALWTSLPLPGLKVPPLWRIPGIFLQEIKFARFFFTILASTYPYAKSKTTVWQH